MRKTKLVLFLLIVVSFLIACSANSSDAVARDDPNTFVNEQFHPHEGQAPFPPLEYSWVIDISDCFSQESIDIAHEIFNDLQQDRIAEIVVICQSGISSNSPTNNELIWAENWGNWARIGHEEDRRAMVILFRPDVEPSEGRVTIEKSRGWTNLTPIDYFPIIEEGGNFANYSDFDGALEHMAWRINELARQLVIDSP